MFSELDGGAVQAPQSLPSDVAIHVRGLTKSYEIYNSPSDRLKQFVLPRLRKLAGLPARHYFRPFSALKNVSFEIRKGETVGIIGRNGAGKSTLLQLLCGTVSPTSGEIQMNGRIAALLELGAGFNTEFTGRENIYMNAGILGLSKDEIDARLGDIIVFADIGEFLDQPVKTYSSGMYVRLAFAVAVHVDADILIVDEALAVGDMYFQAKCMAHMKRLMSAGTTILFVSHDIGSVKALCNSANYLDSGEIALQGPTDVVADAYYGKGIAESQASVRSHVQRPGPVPVVAERGFSVSELESQAEFAGRAAFQRIQNGMADWLDVRLLDERGEQLQLVAFGQTVTLRMTFRANLALASLAHGYHIRDRNGADIVYSDTEIEDCHITNYFEGEVIVVDWSFKVSLRDGPYTVAAMLSIPQDLSIGRVEVCDYVPLAVNFEVARGQRLPIYGYVHWENSVNVYRSDRISRGD